MNIAEFDKSIDIFNAGALVLHVRLFEQGCIDNYCVDRLEFNERFLGYRHYERILD